MMVFIAVITVIAAYLMGSVNYAVIFSKLFCHNDIRNFGSGNAGTTNVVRVAGALPGVLTLICDALKSIISCAVGKAVFDYIHTATGSELAMPIYGAYLCGVACLLGHVFPIFFQFRGGKGIATGAGVFVICCPLGIAIAIGVFIISMVITRIVSISSILATATVVTLSLVWSDSTALFWPQAVLSVAMGLFVIIKHKDNIKRIIKGEEKKLTIGRKK